MLAQAAETATNWMDWADRFGWPGIIGLLVIITISRLWKWGQPWLDKWIMAKIEERQAQAQRHKDMAESLKKLTDRTIEIQQSTENSVNQIKQELPQSCKWKPPTT